MKVGNNPKSGVVTGNFYQKYQSRNPIEKILVNGFLSSLKELRQQVRANRVFEIGCGEGFLAPALYIGDHKLYGCDISEVCIQKADQNATRFKIPAQFSVRSIYDLKSNEDSADLIVCCELLEHLDDPDRAVDILADLAKPNLICSVPREPIWRIMNMARGRYLTRFGNTPGHLHNWSVSEFRKLISQKFDIIEERTPLPWTFLRCVVK